MENFNKLSFFLRKTDYYKISLYFFLLFINFFLEIFSIGLIFPIISLILDKNFFSENINFIQFILYYSPFKSFSENEHFQLISFFLLIFVIVIFLKNMMAIYINFYRSNFTFLMLSDLKLKMISKYSKIRYLESLKIKSSDVIVFVQNQLARIVSIIENILILSLEFSVVFGIVIFLFLFDTYTSLLLVLAICFFSLILVLFLKAKIFFYGEVRRKSEADLLFLTSNLISGLKEIKLSGFIKIFLNNFNHLSVRGLKANRNFNFISNFPRSYLEVIIALLIAIFLFVNLLRYEEINSSSISSATIFLVSGLRILPSIGKIINSYNSYRYQIPTLDKIHKFSVLLNKIKEQKSKFIKCNKNIELKNINFSYNNKKNVLENCNINISMGDKIGLYGASGSGKTTLINLISGLIKQTKGKIFIDGFERSNFIISNMSIVSQNPLFINDTIKNNLNFVLNNNLVSNHQINSVLSYLDLNKVIKDLENGIDTVIGEKGSKLSGGQLQRINIARAILKKSDILILDEATNALDNKTEKLVMQYLFKVFKNKIIIIISHDKRLFNLCDYTLTINKKKIIKKNV